MIFFQLAARQFEKTVVNHQSEKRACWDESGWVMDGRDGWYGNLQCTSMLNVWFAGGEMPLSARQWYAPMCTRLILVMLSVCPAIDVAGE